MKKYIFIFPLLFILGIAYWRHTYWLNPNLSNEAWLIAISESEGNGTVGIIQIKSIVAFWVLFFVGNAAFFIALFNLKTESKIMVLAFLLISLASILLFVAHHFIIQSASVFGLAAIIKNFVLSPVFTGTAYILIRHFVFFEK